MIKNVTINFFYNLFDKSVRSVDFNNIAFRSLHHLKIIQLNQIKFIFTFIIEYIAKPVLKENLF